jgi:hypothetical protein
MFVQWNSLQSLVHLPAGCCPHATDTKDPPRIETTRLIRFMMNLQRIVRRKSFPGNSAGTFGRRLCLLPITLASGRRRRFFRLPSRRKSCHSPRQVRIAPACRWRSSTAWPQCGRSARTRCCRPSQHKPLRSPPPVSHSHSCRSIVQRVQFCAVRGYLVSAAQTLGVLCGLGFLYG